VDWQVTKEKSRIPIQGELWDVICEGDVAYVAAGSEGLAVIDLRNEKTLASYPMPERDL